MTSIPPTPGSSPLPPCGLAPQPNRLVFGPLAIEWAPYAFPIAVDHCRLNGSCAFITLTAVTFRRQGLTPIEVPAGFRFDGASIPRWFWWVPGFAPMRVHLWAALCHDWLCVQAREYPERMDREIADAFFALLLKHTMVGWRGYVMDLGVSGYRRWNDLGKLALAHELRRRAAR